MVLISIILALIIERLGARSEHWQIDFYLTKYISWTHAQKQSSSWAKNSISVMVWTVMPAVFMALIFAFSDFLIWELALNTVVLLVCFGCANYRKLYKGYLNALSRGDNEAATLYALQMGQKKTEEETGGETFGQTLAWINFQHYCGVLFWFVCLGVPGAVLYATVRAITERQAEDEDTLFSKHTERLSKLLFCANWLPARIASFGYLIIGNFSKGTKCWLKYALDFKTSNKAVVTHTALAAEQIEQQYYGCAFEASCMVRLVKRNILFYLCIVAALTLFGVID